MNKYKNSGFTLLEVIISVALLSIFVLLLSSILNITTKISKNFLDYSDYEYAMMHKKIFELYEDSEKVSMEGNKIHFINEKENIEHNIVFSNSKIYKQTRNPGGNYAAGYSLLLEKISSYKISEESKEILVITIIDRMNKERILKFKLKDEIKKRKEKEEKEKEREEEKKTEKE